MPSLGRLIILSPISRVGWRDQRLSKFFCKFRKQKIVGQGYRIPDAPTVRIKLLMLLSCLVVNTVYSGVISKRQNTLIYKLMILILDVS